MKEGNITPRRIEEVSNEMKRKMVRNIQRIGEETLREMQIDGVHPEIIRLLGRLKYRTSYGQNVLEHSKEVGRLYDWEGKLWGRPYTPIPGVDETAQVERLR